MRGWLQLAGQEPDPEGRRFRRFCGRKRCGSTQEREPTPDPDQWPREPFDEGLLRRLGRKRERGQALGSPRAGLVRTSEHLGSARVQDRNAQTRHVVGNQASHGAKGGHPNERQIETQRQPLRARDTDA